PPHSFPTRRSSDLRSTTPAASTPPSAAGWTSCASLPACATRRLLLPRPPRSPRTAPPRRSITSTKARARRWATHQAQPAAPATARCASAARHPAPPGAATHLSSDAAYKGLTTKTPRTQRGTKKNLAQGSDRERSAPTQLLLRAPLCSLRLGGLRFS